MISSPCQNVPGTPHFSFNRSFMTSVTCLGSNETQYFTPGTSHASRILEQSVPGTPLGQINSITSRSDTVIKTSFTTPSWTSFATVPSTSTASPYISEVPIPRQPAVLTYHSFAASPVTIAAANDADLQVVPESSWIEDNDREPVKKSIEEFQTDKVIKKKFQSLQKGHKQFDSQVKTNSTHLSHQSGNVKKPQNRTSKETALSIFDQDLDDIWG